MQLLSEDRIIAKETRRHKAEIDSRMTCNSHGSALLYELDLLEIRLLSKRGSEAKIELESLSTASSSSDWCIGRYTVFFSDFMSVA